MKIALYPVLYLALAASLGAQLPLPKSTKVVRTTLESIRKSPDAHRSLWVRFTVQFASLGKISNPFFTQFEPSRFANFYGWSDNQPIWKKDQYEDLFGLLFVNKQSKVAERVYNLDVYQRLELVGVVRNVFQGQPWIEVTEIHELDRRVNTATLSHIYRGEALMTKREWKRAIAELSLAPGDRLPMHVLGQIHKNLAICFLRLGEASEAMAHIENAVDLIGGIDDGIREIAELAKVRPETFLDRSLANSQVQDYQRPMWEAFAGAKPDGEASPAPRVNPPAPAPNR